MFHSNKSVVPPDDSQDMPPPPPPLDLGDRPNWRDNLLITTTEPEGSVEPPKTPKSSSTTGERKENAEHAKGLSQTIYRKKIFGLLKENRAIIAEHESEVQAYEKELRIFFEENTKKDEALLWLGNSLEMAYGQFQIKVGSLCQQQSQAIINIKEHQARLDKEYKQSKASLAQFIAQQVNVIGKETRMLIEAQERLQDLKQQQLKISEKIKKQPHPASKEKQWSELSAEELAQLDILYGLKQEMAVALVPVEKALGGIRQYRAALEAAKEKLKKQVSEFIKKMQIQDLTKRPTVAAPARPFPEQPKKQADQSEILRAAAMRKAVFAYVSEMPKAEAIAATTGCWYLCLAETDSLVVYKKEEDNSFVEMVAVSELNKQKLLNLLRATGVSATEKMQPIPLDKELKKRFYNLVAPPLVQENDSKHPGLPKRISSVKSVKEKPLVSQRSEPLSLPPILTQENEVTEVKELPRQVTQAIPEKNKELEQQPRARGRIVRHQEIKISWWWYFSLGFASKYRLDSPSLKTLRAEKAAVDEVTAPQYWQLYAKHPRRAAALFTVEERLALLAAAVQANPVDHLDSCINHLNYLALDAELTAEDKQAEIFRTFIQNHYEMLLVNCSTTALQYLFKAAKIEKSFIDTIPGLNGMIRYKRRNFSEWWRGQPTLAEFVSNLPEEPLREEKPMLGLGTLEEQNKRLDSVRQLRKMSPEKRLKVAHWLFLVAKRQQVLDEEKLKQEQEKLQKNEAQAVKENQQRIDTLEAASKVRTLTKAEQEQLRQLKRRQGIQNDDDDDDDDNEMKATLNTNSRLEEDKTLAQKANTALSNYMLLKGQQLVADAQKKLRHLDKMILTPASANNPESLIRNYYQQTAGGSRYVAVINASGSPKSGLLYQVNFKNGLAIIPKGKISGKGIQYIDGLFKEKGGEEKERDNTQITMQEVARLMLQVDNRQGLSTGIGGMTLPPILASKIASKKLDEAPVSVRQQDESDWDDSSEDDEEKSHYQSPRPGGQLS